MSTPWPGQDPRATAPTETLAVLASTFALGVLLHAAFSSFAGGLYGHFKTHPLHRRKLVLLLFYMCVALYSLGQFIVLLLLGDVQCQIGVTLTIIAEQLARISGLGIILWKIHDESAHKFEKVGLLGALGARVVLGAVVIGFTRTEFVPVCFMRPGIVGPDFGQLIFDGLLLLYAAIRIPVMLGLFKDQGQATTRSTKEGGKSQGYGLFLITLAYGGWWAGSFPHILGLGNLAVRVFPMVVTLLLLINVLRLSPALDFPVSVAKAMSLEEFDSASPPQNRSRNDKNLSISSPNDSPVLTPRPGDIESNKKRNNVASKDTVLVKRNSRFVFGDIIGVSSGTEVPTLNGAWALTKDQQGRTRQKSLSAKNAKSTSSPVKIIAQTPVHAMYGISEPISGPSMISMPTGLPSGVGTMKTIDLKPAAKIEKRQIDSDFQRAGEQRRQSVDEGAGQSAMNAVDVRTMDHRMNVKRKAIGITGESSKASNVTGGLTRNTSKSSTITVCLVKGANSPMPQSASMEITPGATGEHLTLNELYTMSPATEDNYCNSQAIQDVFGSSLLSPARLDVDISTADLSPELQGKSAMSETVLFANQIFYDSLLAKSLLSPANFMTMNTSAKDDISLGLTASRPTGSSAGLFKHSPSYSPSRSLGSDSRVTKAGDKPPRILTPIMMRKKSYGASSSKPRSLWPGSPLEEVMLTKRVSAHRKSKSNPLNGPPVAPPPDIPLPPLPGGIPTVVNGIKSAQLRRSLSERMPEPYVKEEVSGARGRDSNVSWSPINLYSILSAIPFPVPPTPRVQGNKKAPTADISTFPPPVPTESIQRLESLRCMGSLKRTSSVKKQYATNTRASGVSVEGYATARAWVQNVRKASQGPSLVSICKRRRSGTLDSESTTSDLSETSVGMFDVDTLIRNGWSGEEQETLPAIAMALTPPTLSLNESPELVQYYSEFDDDKGESERTQSEVGDMVESGDEEDIEGGYRTSGEEYSSQGTSDSGSDIEDNVVIQSEFLHDTHEVEIGMEAVDMEMQQAGRSLDKKLDDTLDDIFTQSSPKPRHFKLGDHIPTFSESRRKYGTKRRPPPSPIGWLMKQRRVEMNNYKCPPQKIQDRLTLLATRKSGELDMAELMRQFPGMVERKERESMARDSLLESLEMEMRIQEEVWWDKKEKFRASVESYLDEEEVSPRTIPMVWNNRVSGTSGVSSRLSQTFYAQRMRTMNALSNSQRESMASFTTTTSGSTALAGRNQTTGWQRQLAQAEIEYIEMRSCLTVPADEHLVLNRQSSPAISDVTDLELYGNVGAYEVSPIEDHPHAARFYMTPAVAVQSSSSASSAATEFVIDSDKNNEYEVEEIEAGGTLMDVLAVGEYEYEYESASIEGGFEPLPAAVYCPTPVMSEEGVPAMEAVRPNMRKMEDGQTGIESGSLWMKMEKAETSMPGTEMWRANMGSDIPGESLLPQTSIPRTFLWTVKLQTKQPSLGIDSVVCSVPFTVEVSDSIRATLHQRQTQLSRITSSALWCTRKIILVNKPSLWMPYTLTTPGLWPGGKPPSWDVPAVRTLGLWRDAPTRALPEKQDGESKLEEKRRRRVERGVEKVSGLLWSGCKKKAWTKRHIAGLWNRVSLNLKAKAVTLEGKEKEKKVNARQEVAGCKNTVGVKIGQGNLWQRRGNAGAITLRKKPILELTTGQPSKFSSKTLTVPGAPEHSATVNGSTWTTNDTQAEPDWMSKLRRPSVMDEGVVNSTSITFVITSPVSSVHGEIQDEKDILSSEYAEDEGMDIESMMAGFSPVLLANRSHTYSPYTIADDHLHWDEQEASGVTYYESGSEKDSPPRF